MRVIEQPRAPATAKREYKSSPSGFLWTAGCAATVGDADADMVDSWTVVEIQESGLHMEGNEMMFMGGKVKWQLCRGRTSSAPCSGANWAFDLACARSMGGQACCSLRGIWGHWSDDP